MTFHDRRAPRPAVAPPAVRQPGPVTMALRAMSAAMTTPPVSGPVTAAIRTMRAADPAFDLNPDLIALRRALADRIEADIAALDMLGGDPDLEPSLASPEQPAPWRYPNSQLAWGSGVRDDREDDDGDNPEQENEHGGAIDDEPRDPEEDDDRDSGCADPAGAFEQYGGRLGAWCMFA